MANTTHTCTIAGFGSFELTAFSGGNKRQVRDTTSIDPIVLITRISGKQKHLADIANNVANNKQSSRFTITITKTSNGKTLQTLRFENCLFMSLDFPTCDAGSGALLTETATFRPEMLTVS